MEIVDPAEDAHHHHWLEWLGLQEPPPEPDTWVPIVKAFQIDDEGASSSPLSTRLVAELAEAGIEARRRLYEIRETDAHLYITNSKIDRCVAVVVHERDRARATDLATAFRATVVRESGAPDAETAAADDELARLALESGPPPPD